MVQLTTRQERIVEKKVGENPRWSSDPGCTVPNLIHTVIVSDHTFSGNMDTLSPNFMPYRVSIEVPEQVWERLRVGMLVDIQWVVPDV